MLKELESSIASFVFRDAVEKKPKIAGKGSKTKKAATGRLFK
jgi:stalled ribosome alternative rescue factor ArfA